MNQTSHNPQVHLTRNEGPTSDASAKDVSSELVRLTGFRKRRELDASLVHALYALASPVSVTTWRPSAQVHEPCWSRSAFRGGQGHESADDGVLLATPSPLDAPDIRLQTLGGHITRTQLGTASTTLFPLYSDQEVMGALEVVTTRPLAAATADLIQDILNIYRNVHGLLDYSERDLLTGLLNRKTFDTQFFDQPPVPKDPLPAPIEREARSACVKGDTWVGVIDVDHFKSVNDRYGHLIGDEVLILLAQLMKRSFRAADGLFRFGGEEFVALLRNVSAAHIHEIFERFRAAVEGATFPQVNSISVSIGFAPVTPGDAPSDVIGRADQAVYYAKHHGRNQVRSYIDLVVNNELEGTRKSGDIELF